MLGTIDFTQRVPTVETRELASIVTMDGSFAPGTDQAKAGRILAARRVVGERIFAVNRSVNPLLNSFVLDFDMKVDKENITLEQATRVMDAIADVVRKVLCECLPSFKEKRHAVLLVEHPSEGLLTKDGKFAFHVKTLRYPKCVNFVKGAEDEEEDDRYYVDSNYAESLRSLEDDALILGKEGGFVFSLREIMFLFEMVQVHMFENPLLLPYIKYLDSAIYKKEGVNIRMHGSCKFPRKQAKKKKSGSSGTLSTTTTKRGVSTEPEAYRPYKVVKLLDASGRHHDSLMQSLEWNEARTVAGTILASWMTTPTWHTGMKMENEDDLSLLKRFCGHEAIDPQKIRKGLRCGLRLPGDHAVFSQLQVKTCWKKTLQDEPDKAKLLDSILSRNVHESELTKSQRIRAYLNEKKKRINTSDSCPVLIDDEAFKVLTTWVRNKYPHLRNAILKRKMTRVHNPSVGVVKNSGKNDETVFVQLLGEGSRKCPYSSHIHSSNHTYLRISLPKRAYRGEPTYPKVYHHCHSAKCTKRKQDPKTFPLSIRDMLSMQLFRRPKNDKKAHELAKEEMKFREIERRAAEALREKRNRDPVAKANLRRKFAMQRKKALEVSKSQAVESQRKRKAKELSVAQRKKEFRRKRARAASAAAAKFQSLSSTTTNNNIKRSTTNSNSKFTSL